MFQTSDELRTALKAIRAKSNNLKIEKKGNDELIKSLELTIDNAIENDEEAVDIKHCLREKKTKLVYRKVLNSKIKEAEKALDDCIEGVKEYDENQLSLFNVDEAQKEFAKMQEKKEEQIEKLDDSEALGTPDDVDKFFGDETSEDDENLEE